MSIFTHFDANYGEGYYSAIPTTEGSDILQTGTIVHHHQPETLSFENGNLVIEHVNHSKKLFGLIEKGDIEHIPLTNIGNKKLFILYLQTVIKF